ncbi:MAG: hypothetical protein MR355_09300 [Lachnospiraceae bacterium]|nr:hypothetical protein [Lachnospiraceae bacterium]
MKDKIKKEVEEKKTYFKYMRLMAGGACYLLFTLLAVYVGGWLMFLEPLKGSVTAYLAGELTVKRILVTLIKCLLSTTVAGAIWCIGYISRQKFIGHPEC